MGSLEKGEAALQVIVKGASAQDTIGGAIGGSIDWILVAYGVLAFVSVGIILAAMILYTRNKLISKALCTLLINDKPELTCSTTSGITLLNALLKKGIPIPSPCGGKAICKQCKVQVYEGGGEPLDVDRAIFTRKEIASGWRLSCQCKVKETMRLHIAEAFLSVKSVEATVISNENVATFIKELIVELPEAIPYRSGGYMQFHVPPFKTNSEAWKATMAAKFYPDWQQFALFGAEIDYSGLKEELIRAYSMASYPEEGRRMIFNIRIATPPIVASKLVESIPWGVCSSYAFSLKAGDKIKLSGAYGESFMREDARELVFLIGGAGSSFGRSHLLDLFRSKKSQRKVSLWYGARSLKENIYQAEYEAIAREFPNFTYNLVLSNPLAEDLAAGWPKEDPIRTNFAFKAFELGQLKSMPEPENALYYVCGPPLHNQSIMKLLDQYGVDRESIILDDFGS